MSGNAGDQIAGQPNLRVSALARRAWALYQADMGRVMLAVWLPLGVLAMAALLAVFVLNTGSLALQRAYRPQLSAMNANLRDILWTSAMFGSLGLAVCGAAAVTLPALVRSSLDIVRGKGAAVPFFPLRRFVGRGFASSLVAIACGLPAPVACFANAASIMPTTLPATPELLGAAAFFAFGVVVSAALVLDFWPYLWVLVDRNAPGLSCFAEAVRIIQGRRAKLVVLALFALAVASAATAALGVGLLLAVPYLVLLATVTYCELARCSPGSDGVSQHGREEPEEPFGDA